MDSGYSYIFSLIAEESGKNVCDAIQALIALYGSYRGEWFVGPNLSIWRYSSHCELDPADYSKMRYYTTFYFTNEWDMVIARLLMTGKIR